MASDRDGVVVRDIDIPFGRLVVIFIKMFLAMIPAVIGFTIIMSIVMTILAAIFGGMGMIEGGMMHFGR